MAYSIRPYVLAESNWKSVKEQNYTVAILPWGATEAHNYHLPYATDNFQTEFVSISAAQKAWNNQAKVVVLPTIPFGVNTGQMKIPLCINMSPSTQYAVLKDIVQVLSRQNLQKLIIVNSHGGNDFKQMTRELSLDFPNVFVCTINWWKVTNSSDYFGEPGDHAGELETSTMMYIAPHLVLPIEQAGTGSEKKFKLTGLKEGWVSAQRQWTKISEDTGVGNPKNATPEKGKAFLDRVIQKLSAFIQELHHADINDMYE